MKANDRYAVLRVAIVSIAAVLVVGMLTASNGGQGNLRIAQPDNPNHATAIFQVGKVYVLTFTSDNAARLGPQAEHVLCKVQDVQGNWIECTETQIARNYPNQISFRGWINANWILSVN